MSMIRPARKEDVKQAVCLIYDTIGAISHTLTGSSDPEEVISILEDFFVQENNRLSYQNILVKEVDNTVAGVLLSYHGSRAEELDRPFADRLKEIYRENAIVIDKETNHDEYYLDTLAVTKNYHRRGFGRELMKAFEEKGIAAGYDTFAVLVEPDNEPAYHLYTNMGYKADETRIISGIRFYHLIKRIR